MTESPSTMIEFISVAFLQKQITERHIEEKLNFIITCSFFSIIITLYLLDSFLGTVFYHYQNSDERI